MLWIDDILNIEVTGIAHGPAQSMHRELRSIDELREFANEAKFPEHHLVIRPNNQDNAEIYKNIKDELGLLNAFNLAKKKSSNGLVFVENDLRAFSNPTRQVVIRDAAKDLVQKLNSLCPKCTYPGYWRKKRVPGMLCGFCHRKTHMPIAEIWHCTACAYEEQRETMSNVFADPSKCDFCNP